MHRDFILKIKFFFYKGYNYRPFLPGALFCNCFSGQSTFTFLVFQAVSIVGNEVFRFNLDLYPDATEGDSYTDMSTVDGVVALHVGCIQIVYLHKFLMSLLVKSLFICSHFTVEAVKCHDYICCEHWVLGGGYFDYAWCECVKVAMESPL